MSRNLKKYYYQDYYDREEVDLSYAALNSGANQSQFEQANYNLYEFAFDASVQDKCLSKLNLLQAAARNLQWSDTQQWQGMELCTTYPGLLSGIGYKHETKSEGELKLGFFFDHTTGLPILPGSSIKGVLRSVFPHYKWENGNPLQPLTAGADEITKGKATFIQDLFGLANELEVHRLELAIFESLDWDKTAALAKAPSNEEEAVENRLEYLPISERDIFLDAYISGSFYEEHFILGPDALTPHGDNPLKNPTPLPFLKILPGVKFQFQFLLTDTGKINAAKKREVFEAILTTVGVGAKTNVGYGQLSTPKDFRDQYPDPLKRPFGARPAPKEKTETNKPKVQGQSSQKKSGQQYQAGHKSQHQALTPAAQIKKVASPPPPPPPPPPPSRGPQKQFMKGDKCDGEIFKLDDKKSAIHFVVIGNNDPLKFSDKAKFSSFQRGQRIRIEVVDVDAEGQIKSFKPPI